MILTCRSCGSHDIQSVISLGFTPLANALLTEDQLNLPEEKYPLDLVFCAECTLVQIVETVPPEKLFSQYFYTSSISQTTLDNAKKLTDELMDRLKLNQESAVLEIGSNDGYLLQNYVDHGVPVWGVEPAKNLADLANKKGIRTWCGFFNEKQAKTFVGGVSFTSKPVHSVKIDVVHANNVLAHVADLHSVIEGIKILLKPDGVAVIETHYVGDLIDSVEFDCVYHEHLCYYSVTSLKKLFEFHGMELVDVGHIDIHGGSIRAFFQLKDGPKSLKAEGQARVDAALKSESDWGVDNKDRYQQFGKEVLRIKKELLQVLRLIKKNGHKIAIYGASAKSTTLLNYFGIGKDMVGFVVDDTPGKQGKFTPGTHLPIYHPSKLLEEKPDYVLILTWNFADEIISRNEEYRAQGGKFIIPIPKLEVVA